MTVEEMADTSINPKIRSFYHRFNQMNEASNGDLGREKMWNLMAGLKEAMPGINIAYQRPSVGEEKEMCIAIVTPLMSRVHAMVPQAAEIMFVDSTSHVAGIESSRGKMAGTPGSTLSPGWSSANNR